MAQEQNTPMSMRASQEFKMLVYGLSQKNTNVIVINHNIKVQFFTDDSFHGTLKKKEMCQYGTKRLVLLREREENKKCHMIYSATMDAQLGGERHTPALPKSTAAIRAGDGADYSLSLRYCLRYSAGERWVNF